MGKSWGVFEMQGFKALDRMLQQLPKAMAKGVLRRALMKAGRPIEAAARRNAPNSSPDLIGPRQFTLAQSIIVSPKLAESQRKKNTALTRSAIIVFVGSTHPLAHLVEFGTRKRYQQGKKVSTYTTAAGKTKDVHLVGRYTGQMPANPFMRTAWEATKHEALRILVKEIETELLKAVKRLRTRAERGTLGKRQVKELLG